MKTGPERAVWIAAAVAVLGAAVPASAGSTNTNPPSARAEERVSPKVEPVDRLIGKPVKDARGRRIGKLNDLVVDLDCGRVLFAIVSAGGFAGMGERHLAVPPGVLQEQGGEWRLKPDAQNPSGAPPFTAKQESRLDDVPYATAVYKYFRQATWWEIGNSNRVDSEFNNAHKATELIGRAVQDLSDKKIGEVNNLAIDFNAGRVVCVVFAADRSLRLPDPLYPLPPNALTPAGDRKTLSTGIRLDRLASAPGFDRNHWPDMSSAAWSSQLHQYYGKQAYFDSGELRATGRTNSPPRIYHEPPGPKD